MEQDKIIKKSTVIYTVIAPILHSYKCNIDKNKEIYILGERL